MNTLTPTWQDLFREQRHALLGLNAKPYRKSDVCTVADDEILLVGSASEAARLSQRAKAKKSLEPRCVVLTPEGKEQTPSEFRASVSDLRKAHSSGVEFSGFGPLDAALQDRFVGLDRGVLLAGKAGQVFEPCSDISEVTGLQLPVTAVLVYAPEVTPEALDQALQALLRVPHLVSVVPLPLGAGDRIPLPGLTTAGNTDVMVISVLRSLLSAQTRVRASWAALGWKVAQVALAYGADELAGWTAAETLVYTGRVRAASRVERQELDEGLAEAGCSDAGWPTAGGYR